MKISDIHNINISANVLHIPNTFRESQYFEWAWPVCRMDLMAFSHGERGSRGGRGLSPSNTLVIAAVEYSIAVRL